MLYNGKKRDLIIQFIEGDKLEDDIKKDNNTIVARKPSIIIKYDVSVSSGCENGIYVSNKENSYWLDRHQRSHVEFNITDKELATTILKKLENSNYIFTVYNSFDNITITNISEEEKTFNLIRERTADTRMTLSTKEWKNIKDMDRNYIRKDKTGYSFIVAAPEYCSGDVEVELNSLLSS